MRRDLHVPRDLAAPEILRAAPRALPPAPRASRSPSPSTLRVSTSPAPAGEVRRRGQRDERADQRRVLHARARSTPEETSTVVAPVARIASATLSGVRPPASIHGAGAGQPRSSDQSNRAALPPGPGGGGRRLGLQHQRVGAAGVARQVGCRVDADRAPDRQAEARAQRRQDPAGHKAAGRPAAPRPAPRRSPRRSDRRTGRRAAVRRDAAPTAPPPGPASRSAARAGRTRTPPSRRRPRPRCRTRPDR